MSLFIGIESLQLTSADKRRISHPSTVGVILFSRNYADVEQLKQLTRSIREIAPQKLISVDHEGGRVQRFRQGFTPLPAAGKIGEIFDKTPLQALQLAEDIGVIIGYELRQFDIDFSFTPVLDLRDDTSEVIANRAFHANPAVVSLLSMALRRGLRKQGMAAVGKHYPGHGRVQGDSHVVLPQDLRTFSEREADRLPFIINSHDNIEAIMSAHILLPEDNCPAGFSANCLQQLRDANFDGAIISDDLDMAGAKYFSHAGERAQAALNAGADVVMICNTFSDMDIALNHHLQPNCPEKSKQRLRKLSALVIDEAIRNTAYLSASERFHVKWQALVA